MNFQVETSNHCNFTCGYCPNYTMKRPRQFMRDDVWQAILEQYIIPYYRHNCHNAPPTFIPHKDSEPLLDKKLLDRIVSLPPEMKVDIYTNGVLFPVWKKRGINVIETLSFVPNKFRILLSYHPFNHDNSENDYTEVIAYLKHEMRVIPNNIEFISVSHQSRWVTPEMQDEWVNQWAGYPITVHKNASINPWTGRISEPGTIQFNGCPYGDFGHWFFGVTGNIIACCLDLEEEIVLGNVLTDYPAVMFDKTTRFYEDQRKTWEARAKTPHNVCRNCHCQERDDDLTQIGTNAL